MTEIENAQGGERDINKPGCEAKVRIVNIRKCVSGGDNGKKKDNKKCKKKEKRDWVDQWLDFFEHYKNENRK